MTLVPGSSGEYSQQVGEKVPVTFDFADVCTDGAGNVVDPIDPAHVTVTISTGTGIALGTITKYSSTIVQIVDTTGATAGATVYKILCIIQTTGGQVRNLGVQFTVTDKVSV